MAQKFLSQQLMEVLIVILTLLISEKVTSGWEFCQYLVLCTNKQCGRGKWENIKSVAPKIWLSSLPFSSYTFPCALVSRIWYKITTSIWKV